MLRYDEFINESVTKWISVISLLIQLGGLPKDVNALDRKYKSEIVSKIPPMDIKLYNFLNDYNLMPDKDDPISALNKFLSNNPEFNPSDDILNKYIKTIKNNMFIIKNFGLIYNVDLPINKKIDLSLTKDPFNKHIGLKYKFGK